MFEQIKRLGTDTAIYGVSTILGRFLTFLLTPLYANILARDELGIVATVYAYIAFLNVLYGYGMESAFFKFTSTFEFGDRKQNFSVPFISVGMTSAVLSGVLAWQSGFFAGVINLSPLYRDIVTYAAWILLLDSLAIIPFASLRMARKVKRFATLKLINIGVNVACNVIFLVFFNMKVEGVFLSGVISSALTLTLLIPTILEHYSPRWSATLYAAMLKFGLPYVPAGIATMMIQVIDRPILESLTDKATVGLYQANYRLGIFMMLVVSMFDFAWRPFFLSNASEPGAKQLFARVLTYFVLLTSAIFLSVSFFIDDIVMVPIFFGRSLLPEPYWAGLTIVPLVLLAYMFLGMSNNMVAGIYIEKKTQYLPGITFVGAGVNVAVNFLLIPSLGIMGAAIATLLSYAVMAMVLYAVVQRIYPIQYEFGRIAKIAFAAAVVFGIHHLVVPGSFELAWELILLSLFAALMYWMKFFQPSELRRLTSLFVRRASPPSPTDTNSSSME